MIASGLKVHNILQDKQRAKLLSRKMKDRVHEVAVESGEDTKSLSHTVDMESQVSVLSHETEGNSLQAGRPPWTTSGSGECDHLRELARLFLTIVSQVENAIVPVSSATTASSTTSLRRHRQHRQPRDVYLCRGRVASVKFSTKVVSKSRE